MSAVLSLFPTPTPERVLSRVGAADLIGVTQGLLVEASERGNTEVGKGEFSMAELSRAGAYRDRVEDAFWVRAQELRKELPLAIRLLGIAKRAKRAYLEVVRPGGPLLAESAAQHQALLASGSLVEMAPARLRGLNHKFAPTDQGLGYVHLGQFFEVLLAEEQRLDELAKSLTLPQFLTVWMAVFAPKMLYLQEGFHFSQNPMADLAQHLRSVGALEEDVHVLCSLDNSLRTWRALIGQVLLGSWLGGIQMRAIEGQSLPCPPLHSLNRPLMELLAQSALTHAGSRQLVGRLVELHATLKSIGLRETSGALPSGTTAATLLALESDLVELSPTELSSTAVMQDELSRCFSGQELAQGAASVPRFLLTKAPLGLDVDAVLERLAGRGNWSQWVAEATEPMQTYGLPRSFACRQERAVVLDTLAELALLAVLDDKGLFSLSAVVETQRRHPMLVMAEQGTARPSAVSAGSVWRVRVYCWSQFFEEELPVWATTCSGGARLGDDVPDWLTAGATFKTASAERYSFAELGRMTAGAKRRTPGRMARIGIKVCTEMWRDRLYGPKAAAA